MKTVASQASKPNPRLEPFQALIGVWRTEGRHPYVPATVLHGRATFEWIEGGAFIMMRSEIEHPEFPAGIAIFGSDDASGAFFMLYFDERGVSRKFDVTMHDNVCEWSRLSPDLSQRVTLTIARDGRTMAGRGLMSKDGSTW